MNSAQEKWYNMYIRPVNFTQADAWESLRIARRYKRWASINYFVMPGVTDTVEELESLRKLIADTKLSMIQWRNFNIDPDWLFGRIEYVGSSRPIGVKNVMHQIRTEFPHVYFGYFNPHADVIAKYLVDF